MDPAATPRRTRALTEPGAGPGPDAGPRPEARPRPEDWALWSLIAAALLSRLVWVIWVHPPDEHVFSDMAHYVYRARLSASFEIEPGMRMMAWQAWGTHALLAIPMVLLGPGESALELAGLMWAGCSAATVVLGYLLARRALPGPAGARLHWPALAVGIALLGWVPLISHTGYFVSETPYACVLLAATLGLVRLVQDGRGALSAGVWGALAFALRPQVAVFFVLVALAWLLDRRRRSEGSRGSWSRRIDARAALLFGLPLAVVLAISMVRFYVHTGRVGGVAENASMNLTAGRCHNIVTRAWSSEDALASGRSSGSPQADRRISLPGFRALGRKGPDHPLALRPALGGEAIDLVGYIGDPALHRQIRRRCWAATGIGGQLHYTLTNVALLWVVARPWPESSDRWSPELLTFAVRGRDLAACLAPLAVLGMLLALLAWARGRPDDPAERERLACLGLCALQLASLLIVAGVFFGTPRLRTPYDPYALILCVALVSFVMRRHSRDGMVVPRGAERGGGGDA